MDYIANLGIKETYTLKDGLKEFCDILSKKVPVNYYCINCKCERTFARIDLIYSGNYMISLGNYCRLEKFYALKYEDNKIMYQESSYNDSYKELSLYSNDDIYFIYQFKCPICNNYITQFFVKIGDKITKIYQNEDSSAISTNRSENILRRKYISKIYEREYDAAIKLNNNGYYVGSYIYLRRVLENMINNIYETNKFEIKISEDKEFNYLDSKTKIGYIKKWLPILGDKDHSESNYQQLYKILSEGVHSLSEEICSKYCKMLIVVINNVLTKLKEIDDEKESAVELNRAFNDVFNKSGIK